jgi:hypothetical protein
MKLMDLLAAVAVLPDGLDADDQLNLLAADLAPLLDHRGVTPADLRPGAPLADAWTDQLGAVLLALRLHLEDHLRDQAVQAVERRRQAAGRAAETRRINQAWQGLFAQADTPHDWLGLDHDLPTQGDQGADQ